MKIYHTEPERLSAALCDAHGQMSMASLETRLIVAATRHADALGIGYRELIKDGNVWVLSRMSIEMERMPGILETFSVATWVESFMRHMSYRNFTVYDGCGRAIGYARSLWICISVETRRPTSLTAPDCLEPSMECPIAPIPRLAPAADRVAGSRDVTFTYSDIDFNRHVNSARYVEHIADALGLDWHDRNRIRRLDIAYLHETHCGAEARIELTAPETAEDGAQVIDTDIVVGDTVTCRARISAVSRAKDENRG